MPDFDDLEFALTEIDVKAYQYLQWKKAGLLFIDSNSVMDNKWVKVSYTEAAWLKLLQIAKSFEIPNRALLALKKELIVNALAEPKNIMSIDKLNSSIKVDKLISEIGAGSNQMFGVVKNSFVIDQFPFNTKFNSLLVSQILEREGNTMFFLHKIGEDWAALSLDLNMLDQADDQVKELHKVILQKSHYVLVLKECIGDLTGSFFFGGDKTLMKNKVLSKKEKELIKQIRTGNFNELRILIDDKNTGLKFQIKNPGIIEHDDLRKIGFLIAHKSYKKIKLIDGKNEHDSFEIER